MEVRPLSKGLEDILKRLGVEWTYSVEGQETPEQDQYFLVEWHHVETLRQVGGVGIDDVLEVFGEALVKGVHVDSAMDDPEEPKDLICGQVFNDLLLNRRINLNLSAFLLNSTSLSQKVLIDLVERDMASSDQVVEIVETGRLVFDQHQQKMGRKTNQSLLLSSLVDCRHVGQTVPSNVIGQHSVNEADE